MCGIVGYSGARNAVRVLLEGCLLYTSVSTRDHADSFTSCPCSGKIKVAFSVTTIHPVSYTHLDVYKRQGELGSPLLKRPLFSKDHTAGSRASCPSSSEYSCRYDTRPDPTRYILHREWYAARIKSRQARLLLHIQRRSDR